MQTMDAGYIQQWHKCLSKDLEQLNKICFSTFCANKSILEPRRIIANSPRVTNTVIVSTTFTTHSTNIITSTKILRPLGSNKEKHPLIEQGNL